MSSGVPLPASHLVARREATAGQGPVVPGHLRKVDTKPLCRLGEIRTLTSPAATPRPAAGRGDRRHTVSGTSRALSSLSLADDAIYIVLTSLSSRLLATSPAVVSHSPSLSLSLSLSQSGIRDSPLTLRHSSPLSTPRHALFTHHPALEQRCDSEMSQANERDAREKRAGLGKRADLGQIAIALSHSRHRAATARREGSGHDCQHRSRQTRSAHRRLNNTFPTTITRA
jgi:hypothetical protein